MGVNGRTSSINIGVAATLLGFGVKRNRSGDAMRAWLYSVTRHHVSSGACALA